ncbi:hypothetical protein [Croceivirga thetidis]|uniref:Periplasmic heavy metal sensor n=1 Tax=Croceivirga thetidis TaxID=2721623 RepID=A0ABX1GKJ5_9FLAO|nr:hypothetical protein [Croceivirga thetidis]NKI30376.1 hypothetical protein [Croceivirga thetidis]
MKKNLPFTILLIFLMAMNAALILLLFRKDKQNERLPRVLMSEVLNFDASQAEQFQLLDVEHHDKMRELSQEQWRLKDKLLNEIDNINFSKSERDSLIRLIGEYEEEKNKELFSFFVAVDKLCTQDQKKKLRRIIQRPKPGNGPPPPPMHK